MDGSSGTIHVIEDEYFYCNHHGAVLKPLAKTKMDLLWAFAQQAEPILKKQASNQEGSATLTMPTLESFSFKPPSVPSVIHRIAEGRKKLIRLARLFK